MKKNIFLYAFAAFCLIGFAIAFFFGRSGGEVMNNE